MAIKIAGTEVISDDKRILNNESLPDIRPSLLLDFANSKTLDPRITFTRGSTATYWDGKTTAKAEENLRAYSQELDNSSWLKSRVDVTANNTTAPDGTTTAEKVAQASGETNALVIYQNDVNATAGDSITCSVFAKAGTNRDFIFLDETALDGTFNNTWFNLSTGAVGTTNVGHTATITDAGNGWYRCSITFTATATVTDKRFGIRVAEADNTVNVTDNQGFVYLWGAQVEQRSSATAYTPTTTAPIVKYQPVLQTAASGEARFDHDPVTGESKGLLLEEPRTNLVTYSEAFDDANWVKASISILANTLIAPDGTLTADKMVENTLSNAFHTLSQNHTLSDNVVYTASIFLKRGERYKCRLGIKNKNGNYPSAIIDLSTGTLTEISSPESTSITDVGNGWYHCTVSANMLTGANTPQFVFWAYDDSGNIQYTGDGYSGIYVWGAQLEKQPATFRVNDAPSSYIPTSGSTVTRAQDHGFISQADAQEVYNPSDFTLYHESINAIRYSEAVGISPGIGSILATFSTSSMGNDLYSSATSVSATNVGTDYVKAAVGVNLNSTEYTMAASGNVTTVTATKLPFETTGIRIGSRGAASTSFPMQGTIKKVAIYPKALSSATLQAMTEE